MNNDLISREALKEELKQYFTDGVLDGVSARLAFNQILHDIDNAPTVAKDYDTGYQDGLEDGLNDIRPQDEWIPVSERLPEAYGEYLITDLDGDIRKDTYNDYFKEFNAGNYRVIAWQPLPEPYRK